MSYINIDKVYSIIIDVMTGVSSGSGSATFYNTDSHTSFIEVTVTNGVLDFDMTVYDYVLVVDKADKTQYKNSYVAESADKLTVALDSEMLSAVGTNYAQLYIMKPAEGEAPAKVLTMIEFNYMIKEGNYNELAPESTDHDSLYVSIRTDVDEILRMIESGEIGGSGGLTPTQKQQLADAYNHSQTAHITTDNVNTAIAAYVEAHKAELKGDKGDTGEQGIQGIQGEKGETGSAGAKGADGLSAYQIWLNQGNTGTEDQFIASLKGEQGIQGIQGEKGETGTKGEKGDIGASGADGQDGLTTAVAVNGTTYNHVNGTVTLPDLATADHTHEEITNACHRYNLDEVKNLDTPVFQQSTKTFEEQLKEFVLLRVVNFGDEYYGTFNCSNISDLTGGKISTLEGAKISIKFAHTQGFGNYHFNITLSSLTNTMISRVYCNTTTPQVVQHEPFQVIGNKDMASEQYVQDKIAEAALGGEVDLSGYQLKSDSTLTTTDKTVVGGINEVKAEVGGKADADHTHDSVYSPISHLHNADYLRLNGGTMQGSIYFENGSGAFFNGGEFHMIKPETTGGWARGLTLRDSYAGAGQGAIGFFGNGTELTYVYIGAGTDSWAKNKCLAVTPTELTWQGKQVLTVDQLIWANVLNKPEAFPPEEHTHSYNDLTDKPEVTNGVDGEDGATFTPAVDSAGNLSWSNDKGLANPTTVNIKGAKGDTGASGQDGADGLTTSIAVNGTTYNHTNGTITLPNYPSIEGLATEDYVNDAIADIQLGGGDIVYDNTITVNTTTSELASKNISGKLCYSYTNNNGSSASTLLLTYVSTDNADFFQTEYQLTGQLYTPPSSRMRVGDRYGFQDWMNSGLDWANLTNKPKSVIDTVKTHMASSTLTMTDDKYQFIIPTSAVTVTLPTIDNDTDLFELHLIYKSKATVYTLTFNDTIRWQNTPTLEANKVYEFIFTKYQSNWLGGVVVYQ